MKLYRFSPIESQEQLIEAIKHTHFSCFELCKKAFDKYMPVAGNMGIFCHYDSEYKFLIELRKKLTEESDNLNQKYFRLHEPIVIPEKDDVPETTYTYLYIRRPDQYRAQVGDIDFVVSEEEYKKLKNALKEGKNINGARVFDRPDLDMIELSDPDVDALAYLSTKAMTEKVRVKTNNTNLGEVKNNLVVELHIPDFQQARDFYGLFGFKEIHYDPTSGGGSDLGYMVLKREDEIGNTSINFYGDNEKVSQHEYFTDFPVDTQRGYEVEITIPVSNVKKLWEEVKNKIPEKQIAQSLTLKRWNKWDFRVADPLGFYVRFTELVDWGQ